MLQQRVTERSEHAVVVTVQLRPPRQIDGLCNTTRPPRCLGKNHPGITPFGYCLVPLWSATLLRDISVRDISVILRLAVSKELEMNTAPVPVDLTLFKAYDVRGIAGENLTDEVAYRIGRAAAQYLNVPEIAVGRDMRLSSPQLAETLIRGITDQGVNAIDLGMTTTDELYFAVGKFNYSAGAMITASHNPGKYNGIKFCRAQAFPVSLDTGLADIRDLAISGNFSQPASKGSVTKRDVLDDYVKHALSFIDVSKVKPLKVVIDAGNGMAGLVMPRVFEHLPCELVPLYFELDGSFPHHPASPIEPENMIDVQQKVREVGADLGAAFDGDADRM